MEWFCFMGLFYNGNAQKYWTGPYHTVPLSRNEVLELKYVFMFFIRRKPLGICFGKSNFFRYSCSD